MGPSAARHLLFFPPKNVVLLKDMLERSQITLHAMLRAQPVPTSLFPLYRGTCKLLLELLSFGVSMALGNALSFLYFRLHGARVRVFLL